MAETQRLGTTTKTHIARGYPPLNPMTKRLPSKRRMKKCLKEEEGFMSCEGKGHSSIFISLPEPFSEEKSSRTKITFFFSRNFFSLFLEIGWKCCEGILSFRESREENMLTRRIRSNFIYSFVRMDEWGTALYYEAHEWVMQGWYLPRRSYIYYPCT